MVNRDPGIRIVLMNLRARLRDIIVDAVANEPGLEIVVEDLKWEQDLLLVSGDVVIAGAAEPQDVEVPMRLLEMAPRMRVLMIAISGERAVLYELRPQKTTLGDLTVSGLIAAIRLGADSPALRPAAGREP